MQATPVNPHSSPLVRVALLAYTFLIVYASWYPFSDWHTIGLSPLAYFSEALPRYWTFFDVSINVLGYIPFGILLMLACYPWLPRRWAALLCMLAGSLVSGTMEAVQTYLPSRVPSILDFITNCSGLFIGILMGCVLTPWLLQKDLLRQIRVRWFVPSMSNGLIIVALWPLAQIYPQGYMFGLGQLVPVLSNWLNIYLGIPIDLGSFIRQGAQLSIEQYWLSETIITCCGLIGAVLLFLCLLQPKAPKARLVTLLIFICLGVKSLALALLFKPEHAYSWFSPGAQAGLLVGCLMLYGLAFTPARVQRHLAIFMLTISLLVINFVPGNPYFTDTLSTWVQGKFLNFNGAAQFLAILWPWLAIWFLLHYQPAKSTNPA
ncbi:VanZ family protein [Solimicrobium silvestre]|uniref:VanZ like family n=1 Tax=Solimicrobium silvestre TaxID=2099400 RepID=A0A2S9H3J7_9BURK|nr:VanZ family protein [Solimicrobium silvestre]PRC94555.1 VanZ like family [Solimicrobium silvestre]